MPMPAAKEPASLCSAAPSSVGKNGAQNPAKAPSPATGGPAPTQERTQNKLVPLPKVHPVKQFSADPQVQNMKVSCNVCLMKVTGKEVLGHLFFGNLKCVNCLFVISQCRDFMVSYPPKGKCKNQQHHVLTGWEPSVWKYLSYTTRRNCIITKYCENHFSAESTEVLRRFITSYMKLLLPLKDKRPWTTAFEEPQVKRSLEADREMQKSQTKDNQVCVASQASQNSKLQNTKIQKSPAKDDQVSVVTLTQQKEKLEGTKMQMSKAKDQNLDSAAAQTQQKSKPEDINRYGIKRKYEGQDTIRAGTPQKLKLEHPESNKSKKKDDDTNTAETGRSEKSRLEDLQSKKKDDNSNTAVTGRPEKSRLEDLQSNKSKKKDDNSNTAVTGRSEKSRLEDLQSKKSKKKDDGTNTAETGRPEKSKPQMTKMERSTAGRAVNASTSYSGSAKHMSELTKRDSRGLFISRGKGKSGNNRKIRYSDFVPRKVLKSGHYIVVHHPKEDVLEECPNCNFPFSLEMSTVNFSSFILHLICPNCRLSVYTVPDFDDNECIETKRFKSWQRT